MKRYKLTKNTREAYGITVYQIQATASFGSVKEGDLGGWIQSETNLPQDGEGWVFEAGLVIRGGVIWGGEIWGGEIWGGVIRGGVIRGGVIRGGEIWGGEILGGEILGGEILGGEIWGGTKVTIDVFAAIQLNKHSLTVTDEHISWGCKTMEIKAWFKLTKKQFIAFENGTTEEHWNMWLKTKPFLKMICDSTGRNYK